MLPGYQTDELGKVRGRLLHGSRARQGPGLAEADEILILVGDGSTR